MVRRLTDADDGRDERQLRIVDASAYGSACLDWAGGRAETASPRRATSLVPATVDALAEAFAAESGSLAQRLLGALAAAQDAGGDRRGQQSASLLVVERDGGYAGLSDVASTCASTTTRPDRGIAPPARPARAALRQDAQERGSPSTTLRAELTERPARLGYERLEDWAASRTLEERSTARMRSTRSCWTSWRRKS